ncbi:Signal peptidase I [Psidium guajava]|nr:Signal peptidase I [Psidium guajava]
MLSRIVSLKRIGSWPTKPSCCLSQLSLNSRGAARDLKIHDRDQDHRTVDFPLLLSPTEATACKEKFHGSVLLLTVPMKWIIFFLGEDYSFQ